MTAESRSLEGLLAAARDAEPGDRINLRDSLASYGDEAIDAMADWLGDRRLAGFALRVLEKIGSQPQTRQASIDAILRADRSDWPAHYVNDANDALARLGYRPPRTRTTTRRSRVERPSGLPGKAGRGYWVMRTSPWERSYLWAEAIDGRLRQGWGHVDEQNLYVVAEVLRNGRQLSPLQQEARRALRMVSSWPGGMQLGDVVVAPNLPQYSRLSVFRVAGSYEWALGPPLMWGEQFGHVLPVELLEQDIDRHGREVSDGLRSILGVQTRLYNITGYGGDVERMIGGEAGMDRHRQSWTEAEYKLLFGGFPADGPRPSNSEFEEIAMEIGRTPDAVSWQWNDGASYVQGRSASTTSDVLKKWLDRK